MMVIWKGNIQQAYPQSEDITIMTLNANPEKCLHLSWLRNQICNVTLQELSLRYAGS